MRDKVIIIAEAGVNHNGSIGLAKKLIDAAAEAGVDFVKFQTFKAEKIVSADAKKAAYQLKNIGDDELKQFDMLKKLELSFENHFLLKEYASAKGVRFFSTGFDEESNDFLESLDMPFFKVPSGEITNRPYLQHLARKGKPVILSTGMADMEDIRAAIEVIESTGLSRSQLTILHCNTEYPTPMADVNLLAMIQIRDTFGVKIGYSDHTLGIEVPIAAVALGASVIEKHFTLDRSLEGPDHVASLEPAELKAMVSAIRNIEEAIGGSGIKEPSPSELANKLIARKSVHIKRPIAAGSIIGKEDLIMVRPGDGISPMLVDEIYGKVVKIDLKQGTKLSWEQLAL